MGQELSLRYLVADEIARIFVKRHNSGGCAPDLPNIRRVKRPALPFRSVNLPHRPGYDAGLQRHHLLPRQLLSKHFFHSLFEGIADDWPGLNDFRSNGMLLPCNDAAALQMGLPLHRGPHRDYNAMVIERVGQVEAQWAGMRRRTPQAANRDAVAGLQHLQLELRRQLLDQGRKRLALNRHDPLEQIVDFTHIDALVDALLLDSDPSPAEPGFLLDQPATFAPAIPLYTFDRAASPAWA